MKKYTIAILMLPIAVLAVINFTSDKSQVKSAAIDCATYQNIQQCWDDQIDAALKDQGLAESFRLVSQLYQAEPLFTSDCHGYVHKLGESTYFSYKKGEQINLPPETAYCGYGFYHGFMEKLLTDGGHIVDAGHFCDYAAQRVTTVLADACYHGAGHGAMALSTADPALWSKPGALVSKSTKICNQLSGDEIKISRCNSGVFMEIANYFIGGEYKLEPDSNDPLGICLSQPDDLKMDCYTQMYAVLRKISGNNFQKAVVFVERIKGDRYAEESIQTLAGAMLDIKKSHFDDEIKVCRGLRRNLEPWCIRGLALAFMLNSTPGQEYKEAIRFCQTAGLGDKEQDACFALILSQATNTYELPVISDVCRLVPSRYYGKYCTTS